jgi:hypothetical protein
MTLTADCTTDETIPVPDGYTLDGKGHAVTAVDPTSGHFVGAVVANDGETAYVTNLVVQAQGLENVCDSGDDRLRGIMFDGASGAIWQNTVQSINQGPSGCQEGNAIEVRNAPFDDTHPNTVNVEITQNVVEDYQKGGIICNGDVNCDIHHNFVGESATQQNLAANSIQFGSGATGTLQLNHIAGNQWLGASDYVATAVLVYNANGVTIQRNNIGGNSDVGIYFVGNNGLIDNNRIFDGGPDGAVDDGYVYDWGLIVYGYGYVQTETNAVTNNKIKGFDDPYYNDDPNAADQKVIPAMSPHPVCFGTDCGDALP